MDSLPFELVVAAVIQSGDRYLVGLRPYSKAHGGLWEFPGGKVKPRESVSEAIERELSEELNLSVQAVGSIMESIEDPEKAIRIAFVPVRVTGTPTANEHLDLRWCDLCEIEQLRLAPADRCFVEKLRRASNPL